VSKLCAFFLEMVSLEFVLRISGAFLCSVSAVDAKIVLLRDTLRLPKSLAEH
jgi:hypothetical protein